MILPSDSDPLPDGNHGNDPVPGDPWWVGPDDMEDAAEGLPADYDSALQDPDDPDVADLQTVAPPGWRQDLYKDLMESLRDLQAIEDPDDPYAPPEPPDLLTFFGELAALRQELKKQEQRLKAAVSPPPPQKSAAAKPKEPSGVGAAPWSRETCLALISAWDLLPHAASPDAFEATFLPLFEAAGLTRIPTLGRPFDAATMTIADTAPASSKAGRGKVLQEKVSGFLLSGTLLRPATVVMGS